MTTQEPGQLPHWDLSNVFPGLESEPFTQTVSELQVQLDDLDSYLASHHIGRTAEPPLQDSMSLNDIISGYLDRMNAALRLNRTLGAFVASLPVNAAAVVVSNQAYYVADGVYYQQCFTGTETGYCVVAAP